jgi:hypothetical protein
MRLRSTQRRLAPGSVEHQELDEAVEALEATIAELPMQRSRPDQLAWGEQRWCWSRQNRRRAR